MSSYPKYSRAENKSCKYTLKQIKEIKELYKQWKSLYKISILLTIPQSTVWYHSLSDKALLLHNKKRAKLNKTYPLKKNYNEDRKIRKGQVFNDYENALKKEYIKDPKVKEARKAYMKQYKKTKQIITPTQKEAYSKQKKVYWKKNFSNNEEYKEKKKLYMDEYTSTPEYKEKRRKYMREYRKRKKN